MLQLYYRRGIRFDFGLVSPSLPRSEVAQSGGGGSNWHSLYWSPLYVYSDLWQYTCTCISVYVCIVRCQQGVIVDLETHICLLHNPIITPESSSGQYQHTSRSAYRCKPVYTCMDDGVLYILTQKIRAASRGWCRGAGGGGLQQGVQVVPSCHALLGGVQFTKYIFFSGTQRELHLQTPTRIRPWSPYMPTLGA